MFFLPIATDAPIYHWPFVTVALIAINVIVFALTGQGWDGWLPILSYGQINPLAWLTSNFRHEGLIHLVGNMLFLWPFGLVAEGKLGWWRFLAVYLGVGVIECALEQTVMYSLGRSGGSQGASSIIFGILALCVVWAPKNDFKVFYVFIGYGLQTGFWDVSILTFSGFYVGWEVLMMALTGFQVSSAVLHIFGFAVGFGLGLVLLKLRIVDCEGWDLLAVWSGKLHTTLDLVDRRKQAEATNERFVEKQHEELELSRTAALDLVENHLQEGRAAVAYAVYMKYAGPRGAGWQLPDPLMADLIKATAAQKMWPEAIQLLRRAIADHPGLAAGARLNLAHILIHVEQRPRQAQAVLGKLPLALPDAQARRRDELVRAAKEAIDEGTLEMATEDW